MSGLVSGLQNQPRRFESARHLQKERYINSDIAFFFYYLMQRLVPMLSPIIAYCSNIIINFLKLQNAKTQNTLLYY